MIESGLVTVNGKEIHIGDKADPEHDSILVNGAVIKKQNLSNKKYFLLYKPKGYITTLNDPKNRRTVNDLVMKNNIRERLIPVGRLDQETEGLLIMTNDGDFANKVMHPSHEVEKTYQAELDRPLQDSDKRVLEQGVNVLGRRTWPAKVTVLSMNKRLIEITIHEGRNKIVRRMLQKLEYRVTMLKRTRIGSLGVGGLKPGKMRSLSNQDVEKLFVKMPKNVKVEPVKEINKLSERASKEIVKEMSKETYKEISKEMSQKQRYSKNKPAEYTSNNAPAYKRNPEYMRKDSFRGRETGSFKPYVPRGELGQVNASSSTTSVDKNRFERRESPRERTFDRPNFEKPRFEKSGFEKPRFEKPRFERPRTQANERFSERPSQRYAEKSNEKSNGRREKSDKYEKFEKYARSNEKYEEQSTRKYNEKPILRGARKSNQKASQRPPQRRHSSRNSY
jgi:pseudouridine synthase